MPERLTVRDFDPDQDLKEAAQLLATRHRRDRERFPILPAKFEDSSATWESLKETASFSRSVTALDTAGRMTGFLFAIRRVTRTRQHKGAFRASTLDDDVLARPCNHGER
jgi:hypothetical protein